MAEARRRRAPQLLAAATTYLVRIRASNFLSLFFLSEAQNQIGIMCLACSMSISQDAHGTWGGVIYMAVPFYKRARKIEGMFRASGP